MTCTLPLLLCTLVLDSSNRSNATSGAGVLVSWVYEFRIYRQLHPHNLMLASWTCATTPLPGLKLGLVKDLGLVAKARIEGSAMLRDWSLGLFCFHFSAFFYVRKKSTGWLLWEDRNPPPLWIGPFCQRGEDSRALQLKAEGNPKLALP